MTYPHRRPRAPRRELLLKQPAPHAGALLELLIEINPNLSRTSTKQLLRDRCVRLQGHVVTQFDTPVKEGDLIEIFNIGVPLPLRHPLVEELYSDDYIMVLHKLPGIPTISVGGVSKTSLFNVVAKHIKEVDPSQKIFLLNRLDRDTEGIILLARDRQLQQDLLAEWDQFVCSNTFEAVLLGEITEPEGNLSNAAARQKKKSKSQSPSFRAHYTTLSSNPYISHIQLSLLTRNNAIRSTLSDLGYSILGDTRHNDSLAIELSKHLALLATEITFYHPLLRRRMTFCIKNPKINLKKLAMVRLTRRQKQELTDRTSKPDSKHDY